MGVAGFCIASFLKLHSGNIICYDITTKNLEVLGSHIGPNNKGSGLTLLSTRNLHLSMQNSIFCSLAKYQNFVKETALLKKVNEGFQSTMLAIILRRSIGL